MIRRLPLIPTIVVLAAVAVMIGLGVWQLQRAHVEGGAARAICAGREAAADHLADRCRCATTSCRCSATRPASACGRSASARSPARTAAGEPGYVHIVDCATGAEGPGMSVEVGWSKNPNAKVNWAGGPVSGIIAPDGDRGMRLVAASAPPGLEPSAPPSLRVDPEQPPVLRAAVVHLRRHRARHLRAGAAQALEAGTARDDAADAPSPMACASRAARCPASRPSRSASMRRPARAHEPAHLNGLAHLFEHMVFKGAGGRSAREISERSRMSAATSTPRPSASRPPSTRSLLAPRPAARRRADRRPGPPAAFRADSISSARRRSSCRSWPKRATRPPTSSSTICRRPPSPSQPLGRSVLGDGRRIRVDHASTICTTGCDTQYAPDRLILVAAGKLEHERWSSSPSGVRRHADGGRLAAPSRRDFTGGRRFEPAQERAGASRARPCPRPNWGAPDAYASQLFADVVGGGASSRLFQQLREEQGLAYSVVGGAQNFADTGLFWSYVAARPRRRRAGASRDRTRARRGRRRRSSSASSSGRARWPRRAC